MSLQFSTTVRNAMLDSIETAIGVSAVLKLRTGAQPGACSGADSGTVLISYTLASDWAANASAGAKAFNNTPITGSATGTGTAGHFRLYESTAATCHLQGTITATGGGGDMTIDNTSVASGQTVNVTGFTLTAPGA